MTRSLDTPQSFPPPGTLTAAAKGFLSQREREALYRAALAEQTTQAKDLDEQCRLDGYFWLTKFVYTFDEHAVGIDQIRRFPDVVQPGGARPFQIIWNLLKTVKLLMCIKSRQIMQTWLHAAETLHTALYGGAAVRLPIQSEDQELANALLERVAFMYTLLPPWMKQIHPLSKPITATRICIAAPAGSAGFGAIIKAIPQGANKVRSLTNTKILADEAAFQPEFRAAVKGARPTISGGGRLHAVTTPNAKEYCYELFVDMPSTVAPRNVAKPIREERPAKGIRVRYNRNGWVALELHYSMVPWRDPDTVEGAAWVEEEQGSTPINDWEQEYEISFETYDGVPVYGMDFKPGFHSTNEILFRTDLPTLRSWDYGYRRPYVLFAQENRAGQLFCIYEMLGKDIPIQVFADIVLWVSGKPLSIGPLHQPDYVRDLRDWREEQEAQARNTHDQRMDKVVEYLNGRKIEGIASFDALPRFTEIGRGRFLDYDDPAGSQHNQMSEYTARQVLNVRGIHPTPGEESAKVRVDVTRELFLPLHGTDLPGVVISETGCPRLLEAVRRGYRYPPERYGKESSTVPMKDGIWDHPANGLEYLKTGREGLKGESYGKPKVNKNSILGMRLVRERAAQGAEPMRL